MKIKLALLIALLLSLVFSGTTSKALPENGINVNVNGAPCTGVYISGKDSNPTLPAHITIWQWNGAIEQWLVSQDYPSGLSNGTGTIAMAVSWTPKVYDNIRVIIYHYNPPSVPDSDYTHIYQWYDEVMQCYNSPQFEP